MQANERVDGQQQWGVWGAGAAMAPGNKNGWSQEEGGWVVNTVGFAGPKLLLSRSPTSNGARTIGCLLI